MTKTFLLTFPTIIGVSSFSQNYVSFPTDSATWSYVDIKYYQIGQRIADSRTEHSGLIGDTIIEGKFYSKFNLIVSLQPHCCCILLFNHQ